MKSTSCDRKAGGRGGRYVKSEGVAFGVQELALRSGKRGRLRSKLISNDVKQDVKARMRWMMLQ